VYLGGKNPGPIREGVVILNIVTETKSKWVNPVASRCRQVGMFKKYGRTEGKIRRSGGPYEKPLEHRSPFSNWEMVGGGRMQREQWIRTWSRRGRGGIYGDGDQRGKPRTMGIINTVAQTVKSGKTFVWGEVDGQAKTRTSRLKIRDAGEKKL